MTDAQEILNLQKKHLQTQQRDLNALLVYHLWMLGEVHNPQVSALHRYIVDELSDTLQSFDQLVMLTKTLQPVESESEPDELPLMNLRVQREHLGCMHAYHVRQAHEVTNPYIHQIHHQLACQMSEIRASLAELIQKVEQSEPVSTSQISYLLGNPA